MAGALSGHGAGGRRLVTLARWHRRLLLPAAPAWAIDADRALATGASTVAFRAVPCRPATAAAGGVWTTALGAPRWSAGGMRRVPVRRLASDVVAATTPRNAPSGGLHAAPIPANTNKPRVLEAPHVQRYLLKIEYDGVPYAGAAAQRATPNVRTVQGALEVRIRTPRGRRAG